MAKNKKEEKYSVELEATLPAGHTVKLSFKTNNPKEIEKFISSFNTKKPIGFLES